MNIWTRKSIELANQKNYLDLLYRVYPISENVRREISDSTKNDISNFFNGRNNIELLKILIDQTNFTDSNAERSRVAEERRPYGNKE